MSYEQGFIDKCLLHGVDPVALTKNASVPKNMAMINHLRGLGLVNEDDTVSLYRGKGNFGTDPSVAPATNTLGKVKTRFQNLKNINGLNTPADRRSGFIRQAVRLNEPASIGNMLHTSFDPSVAANFARTGRLAEYRIPVSDLSRRFMSVPAFEVSDMTPNLLKEREMTLMGDISKYLVKNHDIDYGSGALPQELQARSSSLKSKLGAFDTATGREAAGLAPVPIAPRQAPLPMMPRQAPVRLAKGELPSLVKALGKKIITRGR